MERGGKGVLGSNEPSRRGGGAEGLGELCRPWRGARVAGRGGQWEGRLRGRGGGLPGWTPGFMQASKQRLSPHFRLMKENLEVLLFLLILDFLLKCLQGRLDAEG